MRLLLSSCSFLSLLAARTTTAEECNPRLEEELVTLLVPEELREVFGVVVVTVLSADAGRLGVLDCCPGDLLAERCFVIGGVRA